MKQLIRLPAETSCQLVSGNPSKKFLFFHFSSSSSHFTIALGISTSQQRWKEKHLSQCLVWALDKVEISSRRILMFRQAHHFKWKSSSTETHLKFMVLELITCKCLIRAIKKRPSSLMGKKAFMVGIEIFQ